jgi:hypothetical protein
MGNTIAGAQEASQHGEILVEGIDRKHRCQPADQHQFQEQAKHRHQDNRPDPRLRAQIRIIGFERFAHGCDMALQRLGEPAPAQQAAERQQPECDPEQAGSQLRRIGAFERKQPVNGDRRIDEQQAGQGQAEDMNKAAIGIVSNYHGLGPGALVRRCAHASADRERHDLLVVKYSRRVRRAPKR